MLWVGSLLRPNRHFSMRRRTPSQPKLQRTKSSPGLATAPARDRKDSPVPLTVDAPLPPATRKGGFRQEPKQTKPAMPRVQPPVGVLPLSAPRVTEAPPVGSDAPRSGGSIVVTQPFSPWSSSAPPNFSRRPPMSKGVELARMAETLAGETVMGRYRIEIPLGRGSTGIVFRAHDLKLGLKVALKVLDPELSRDPAVVERFRHEALAPSRIGTDHVVQVLEADVCPELVPIARPDDPLSPPIPYLVMELLEGKDLRQYLHERGPLTPQEVVGFLEQVAPTLDKAHALGIVHRDLKPANLFLSRKPDGGPLVKLLDFGIAQLADAGAARGLGGGLFGTPWYMAPEQAEGGIATAASDRWAAALVAFRLLTAESYWAPCPIPELLGQIVEGPQVPPSWVVRERGLNPLAHLGAEFDGWFMHACHVDPRRRFSSMVDQVDAMRRALGQNGSVRPSGPPSAKDRESGERPTERASDRSREGG